MQVDARLGVGVDFAVVVHGNFTNAELNDRFPRFLDGPHGQRTCEYGGDCKEKLTRSVDGKRLRVKKKEVLTEGDKEDEESKALHVGRVEIERR